MKYLMYNGMFEGSIDKRTYELVCYKKSLDPNMDPEERYKAVYQFMFRPDYDVIESLLNKVDGDAKCEAFVAALCNAIKTDEEPWDQKREAIIKALVNNNAQELLIALCGYGVTSLGKLAMLIPDDDTEFYERDMQATLLVYWNNGKMSQTRCRIDVATNKVYRYKSEVFEEYKDSAEISWVAVEVKPKTGKDRYLRWCITEEEREKTKDFVSYWYSTDPEEAQRAGAVMWVDNPFN
jgi:hypothetical protein